MLSRQQQDVHFLSSKREFSWQCHRLFFCFCLPLIFSHLTQSWVPLPYCVARNHYLSLFPFRWSAVYRAKSLDGQDWKTDRVKRCIFRWDQMKTRKQKVDTEADALEWVFEFGCSQAHSVADLQAYQLGLVLLMILITCLTELNLRPAFLVVFDFTTSLTSKRSSELLTCWSLVNHLLKLEIFSFRLLLEEAGHALYYSAQLVKLSIDIQNSI